MVAERVFNGVNSGVQGLDPDVTADDVYYNSKIPFAYDYADKDTDVYPSYSAHGTHVAGIIAGSPVDNIVEPTMQTALLWAVRRRWISSPLWKTASN